MPALVTVAICLVPALAGAPSPDNPAGRSNDILGITPSFGAGHGGSSGSNLTYHGGPVMHANRVYAIYWVPHTYTVSGNYENLINQYFTDVQASAGKNSNAYAAGTQYSQQHNGTTSYVQNNTTFEGSIVDSNPLPPIDPVNCPDVASPLNGTNGTPILPRRTQRRRLRPPHGAPRHGTCHSGRPAVAQRGDFAAGRVGVGDTGIALAVGMLGLVQAVPLTRTGQFITITLNRGGVRIKTVARAMEEGSFGQTIKVKNEATRDVYQVVLTGPQEGSMGPPVTSDTSKADVASARVE